MGTKTLTQLIDELNSAYDDFNEFLSQLDRDVFPRGNSISEFDAMEELEELIESVYAIFEEEYSDMDIDECAEEFKYIFNDQNWKDTDPRGIEELRQELDEMESQEVFPLTIKIVQETIGNYDEKLSTLVSALSNVCEII